MTGGYAFIKIQFDIHAATGTGEIIGRGFARFVVILVALDLRSPRVLQTDALTDED